MPQKNLPALPIGITDDAGLAFRTNILYVTLYVAAIFALLFGLMYEFGLNDIGRFHSLVDYAYSLTSMVFIVLLRYHRNWFNVVVPAFIIVSILCFTSALINVVNDEFRLIWFYFVIFVTYVVHSDRAGTWVTVVCIAITLLSSQFYDLELSSRAMFSGVLGMVIISLLSRTYTLQLLRYESELGEKNRDLQKNIVELDKALADAWQANRTKSLFLANMSHEIRTPMNGVLGMAQVLRGTKIDKDQEYYLDAIQRAGNSLLVLIDDLLDLSRIESGKVEVHTSIFATSEWLTDIRSLSKPLFDPDKVVFTIELGEEVPPLLLGDAHRMTQIVLNLIGNAAKFTREGEVALRVGGEPVGADKFRLELEVRDSGEGIPGAKLAHIFEPFEQVNPERINNKGVGLGLAISRRLARAMGGDLTAESNVGEGSRFQLTLMLEVVRSRDGEGANGFAGINRSLQVLLADDDAISRLAVSTLLAQQGHTVVQAEDGRRAIELLHQADYDLILMDVHMPVMDGLSATRTIRAGDDKRLSQLPIIGLTASVMNDEREQYLRLGMDEVVEKPIVLEQLLRKIASVLRRE